MSVNFTLNGRAVAVHDAAPTTTVLDWLRGDARLTGTKEGCAEGDCGACTVVIARGPGGRREAVNACLMMLPQIDGAEVTTVEGLTGPDGELDPVQHAMVENDASQCGFCTPGFIMALHALRAGGEAVDDATIHDALAGNLCRCTGYRPIVDAARAACAVPFAATGEPALSEVSGSHEVAGQVFHAPRSLDDLIALRSAHPDAVVLGGGTDVGLRVSKGREAIPAVIHTRQVAELRRIAAVDGRLRIGAAVTYTDALCDIEARWPSFAEMIRRIGSRQIRNLGTIGGNIGNASPIGDTPPCLIALDARLEMAGPEGTREIALEDFFLDYRKTDLRAGEVIAAVSVPEPDESLQFRTYKISKRFDQDISAVIGAFALRIEDGVVAQARIAFGGMAATAKRAAACEAALTGSAVEEAAFRAAGAAVAQDFDPIGDHRASRDYRLRVAENLFVRLYRDLAEAGGPLGVMVL